MDPAIFYPEPHENAPEARAVCASCPVVDACLDANLWEDHGIWGNTSPLERKAMRKGVERPSLILFCESCSAPFVGHGRRRYCDRNCRTKAQRARTRRATEQPEEGAA